MGPSVEPADPRISPGEARGRHRGTAVAGRIALGIASLVLHLGAIAALIAIPDRATPPDASVTAVEIVTEPPKPPPPPKAADAAPVSTKPPVVEQRKPAASGAARPPPDASEQTAGPVAAQPPEPAAPEAAFNGLPASFRAVALPATSIGGTEAAGYKAIVFGLLAAAKRYPDGARTRGATGTAVVSFSVDATGRVRRAAVAQSSADPDLDAEALATVYRCDPFPPPPQGAQTSFGAGIEFGREE